MEQKKKEKRHPYNLFSLPLLGDAIEVIYLGTSPVVKNLPANAGDARDLGLIPGFDLQVGKIPLEEEMATHSRILAWRIPWTEEPGGLQSMGPQRVGHD